MINQLGDIESSYHYFKPVWQTDSRLMGMEMMTHSVAKNPRQSLPPAGSTALLNATQQVTLFNEKIALLETVNSLIESRQVTIWVGITDAIVTEMMQNTELVTRIQNLSFVTLMIDEEFPGMAYGRNNLRLIWLAEKFPLALANLGSGKSSNRAIFDGLFRHVFLDQGFVHNQAQRLSFIPFTSAIIRQIGPFCEALIVSGIDNMALYDEVQGLEFAAMRGNLWPSIAAEQLPTLFSTSGTS